MTKRRASPQEIAQYALFGEESAEDDPEFVHIEDIRSRSRRYEWRIKPHAHQRMIQFLFLAEGTATVLLDAKEIRTKAPAAICVPPGAVHAFQFEPDPVGWVLTFAEVMVTDARYRRSRDLLEPLIHHSQILDFSSDPDRARFITETLRQMQAEYDWPQVGRNAMFEWMIRSVLLTSRRQMDRSDTLPAKTGSQRETYTRFRRLLEDHYREHWPITQYAEKLGLSQARLNRLCNAIAGKGASALIQDRVILEAQRYLIYTSANAAMIAYDLGFQDPAYFSRYFKRRTGLAPGAFRDANEVTTTL
ncbi:MAG: helix-turn-helix domain-containing protein [Magnetospiraceae bacterium]